VVRVFWPPLEAAHYGVDEAWQGHEGHPALVRLLERDQQRDVQSLTGIGELPLRFRVAGHDAGDAIAEEVRRLGADAVVVGVPAHRRLNSTGLRAASILRSSSVPVFCIPESAPMKAGHLHKVRSVLIACDLSDASRAALSPAYGLLAGGGHAELLYVHTRGPGGAAGGLPALQALTADERAVIETRLRAAVPAEAAEYGTTTHVSVVEGEIAGDTILQAAERLDVDVITIGTHRRSGLRRALLGSVADHVAHHASRPVFIVRG